MQIDRAYEMKHAALDLDAVKPTALAARPSTRARVVALNMAAAVLLDFSF